MKKKLSMLMCVALILSMLLALTGCSGGDKDKLVGKWKCEADMGAIINEAMAAEDESIAEYLAVDEFKMVVYMEFHEDNTFAMYADTDSLNIAIEKMKEDLADGMGRYMEDMMMEQTGLEMSIDDILAATGMTMDDLMSQIAAEDMAEDVASEVAAEGKFKAADGKLHTSAGLEYEVDPSMYETYTLEGDTLTLLEYVGGDENEMGVNVYPMVFVKVG